MVRKIKYGKGSLRIVGLYINGDMVKKLEELNEWLEEWEEGVKTIIGEDFNARTKGKVKKKEKKGKGIRRIARNKEG